MGYSGVNYKSKAGSKIDQHVVDVLSGCLTTITNLHRHVHEGKAFEIYKVVTGLANNAHTYIELKTPLTDLIHLKNTSFWISEGPVLLKIIEAPTLTTGTTPFVPVNLNRRLKDGSVIASGAVVKVDPTGISGGTEIKAFRFGVSGVGSQESESVVRNEIERLLREDTTYLLDLQNLSGSAIDLTMSMIYYE